MLGLLVKENPEYSISAFKKNKVTLWLGYVQALGSSKRGTEKSKTRSRLKNLPSPDDVCYRV
jgi:hypothetical protein